MKADTVFKEKERPFEAEAIISSLLIALEAPIYPSPIKRLQGAITAVQNEPFVIVHDRNNVFFYEGKKYLQKKSDRLYTLAKKRYNESLLAVLVLYSSRPARNSSSYERYKRKCDAAFDRLAKCLRDYEKGNLDVARIVLSSKQYAWYVGKYRKKAIGEDEVKGLRTKLDIPIRSKSEQNIGDCLWEYAVINHYEERLQINVQKLVIQLEKELHESRQVKGKLYYYHNGACVWNVPGELQWMNSSGSVWRTYDDRSGCITIHPDFTIMLADGSILYWEHSGLLDDFIYRNNASERITLMRYFNGDKNQTVIETSELESNDKGALQHIIKTRIISRIWF